MRTITLHQLEIELHNHKKNLPVFIRIGDQDFQIDDVVYSAEPDGTDAKITIESWTKSETENEPGVFI